MFVQMISSEPQNICFYQTWCGGAALLARVFCEKLDYCNHGHSHSKGQNFNFCTDDIFKPANILLPNLVFWCIIMSQSVMQKGWFAILQGQGHSKGSYDHDSFFCIFWTADAFVTKLGLIVHYYKSLSLQTCLPLRIYRIRSRKSLKKINK